MGQAGTKYDLALSASLVQAMFAQLALRERQVLRAIVAFDVFIYPRIVARLLGLSPRELRSSIRALQATGLIRSTDAGAVGMTYAVLREIFPAEWRLPGPLDALRMAALLVGSTDWYAISRRAELFALGAHFAAAVADFERAAIEASHRGLHAEARSLFMRAVATARQARLAPGYVPDASEDEDPFEHAMTRCRKRAHSEYKKNLRRLRRV
jgi:hypothetical protein